MPFNPDLIPSRVIEAARQRRLIPLIGAGVSRQAGSDFPTWPTLLERFRLDALKNNYIDEQEAEEMNSLLDRGQYLMVAEALRTSFPLDEYETILESIFDPTNVRPAEIHRMLFKLRPPLIMTTNYDTLLEDAYAMEYQQAATVYTYRDAPVVQRHLQMSRIMHRPVIFKIHGSIDEPAEIILSERDYRKLLYQNPGYRSVLSAIFITHVVVTLGFSFKDRELLLLLESLRDSLKHRSSPDFVFLPSQEVGSVEAKRLREDFGIQVIRYNPSPGHPELCEFISALIEKSQAGNPE
jgi:SIR2-like protein